VSGKSKGKKGIKEARVSETLWIDRPTALARDHSGGNENVSKDKERKKGESNRAKTTNIVLEAVGKGAKSTGLSATEQDVKKTILAVELRPARRGNQLA